MKNLFSKCVLAKDHVFDQQQAAIRTNKRNSKHLSTLTAAAQMR